MRTTLFAVLTMLLAVSALPFLSNDAFAVQARSSNTVLVEYAGNGEAVEIVGEWDWSAPISPCQKTTVFGQQTLRLKKASIATSSLLMEPTSSILQTRNVRIAGITKTPSFAFETNLGQPTAQP